MAQAAISARRRERHRALNDPISDLETELTASFEAHPDAEIIRSLTGLGVVGGARVQAEFGDDRTRYANAKCRNNSAGTAPITKAVGKTKGGSGTLRSHIYERTA